MTKQKKNSKFSFLCAFASLRLGVEKFFIIGAFVILFSLGAVAQKTPPKLIGATTLPADFVGDGCSSFPDYDYRDCCFEHDKAYYVGGSWTRRWRADKKLYKCVAAKKGFEHKLIAPVMWSGVRIFGAPFLPTTFRWGFGKSRAKKSKTIQTSPQKRQPSAGELKNQE